MDDGCSSAKTWLTVVVGLGEVNVGGERRVVLCRERGI